MIIGSSSPWVARRCKVDSGARMPTTLLGFSNRLRCRSDASQALVEVARRRLPAADVCEADLEALPFADLSFEAVTAVNSVFYAADMDAAMREVVRVARHGGRVVVTAWGPLRRCEFLAAAFRFSAPHAASSIRRSRAASGHRVVRAECLANLLRCAGLRIVEEGEVSCPFVSPNAEISWRAHASAGPNELAISHSGEEAVRAAFAQIDRDHTRPDGSIRYENAFLWVAGERV